MAVRCMARLQPTIRTPASAHSPLIMRNFFSSEFSMGNTAALTLPSLCTRASAKLSLALLHVPHHTSNHMSTPLPLTGRSSSLGTGRDLPLSWLF